MELIITPSGSVRCLYSEVIRLGELGQLTIRRGSHVEPDFQGQWLVDLAPVGGPVLGPFPSRSAALAAEEAWLSAHWLPGHASISDAALGTFPHQLISIQ